MRSRSVLALVAAVAVAACDSSTPTSPAQNPNAVPVAFAGGTLNAEVATTSAQRDNGLMNRTSIAADSGMLFVFGINHDSTTIGFYMLDTHFDLSVAFLDANRTVINIEDMMRDTETLHFSKAPFRYAVEAPLGWFAAHGVAAGAVATFTLPAGVIIDP